MIPSWTASCGVGAAGQHVADRRRRVGVDVEVVGEVALRIEVDREHVQVDPPEDVGQRADRGRLAGPALLREHRDRCRHRGAHYRRQAGASLARRAAARQLSRSRHPLGAHARHDRDVDEVQMVAADHDLVAVGQRAPLDPLAVDEHAVQASIVEHAQAVRLADDQRVAARHGRVVEADVGGEAAPDPRPLALQRERDEVVARGAVGEVLARLVEPVTDLGQPLAVVDLLGHVDDGVLSGREQRGADELRAPALGHVGNSSTASSETG